MTIEYKKIGVVIDGSAWPQKISHYITLKKIRYDDNIKDYKRALKEAGEYETWDGKNRVFIKEV